MRELIRSEMTKYRSRRQGLTTERLSQNSRDGLERVQQKTVMKNTILRKGHKNLSSLKFQRNFYDPGARESKITTMFELDNSNIKRHLEVS